MNLKILIVVFAININFGEAKTYFNHTLYRTVPKTGAEVSFLKSLSKKVVVKFWKPPGSENIPVDILIGPEDKYEFSRLMKENSCSYYVVIEDVQSAIYKQTVKSYMRSKVHSFDWRSYYRLDDVYNWLKDLSGLYPKEVTIIEIGKTYEGRKILAVRVLKKIASDMVSDRSRPTVFIEGGIHAREWITVSFVTYLLNEIVTRSHYSSGVWRDIANMYEWYFIPVTNPDGYEYSHTTDRLWRKNRVHKYGTDLNRNFDFKFGSDPSDTVLSGESFCGKFPFSEKETRALADLIRSKSDTLEYYLAFHSYGQLLIIPERGPEDHTNNFNEVKQIMRKAAEQIRHKFSTIYVVGTAFETVGYNVSGASMMWVKAKFNTRFVTAFELRDSGRHGFLLPPEEIIPTCLETMDGLEYILRQGMSNSSTLISLNKNGQSIIAKDKALLFLTPLFLIRS